MIPTIKQLDFNDFGTTGKNWFHPCVTRLTDGRWMATMVTVNGSDFYGEPMFCISADEGQTWSTPMPIPSFKARILPGTNITDAVADACPFTSPIDGTVFAFGCTSYYTSKGNICYDMDIDKTKLPREVAVYAAWKPESGWSERKILPLPSTNLSYRTAATQISFTPDGNCLIPIYLAVGRGMWGPYPTDLYGVTAPLYKQQADSFELVSDGHVFTTKVGRGFMEPSAIRLDDGSYAMTIRAEDGNMHVATSTNGVTWNDVQPWKWDDGTPLVTDTTQQHWIRLADRTFLVFTMKTKENEKIFRFRAPLFIAEAIPQKALLIHDTLRTVFDRQQLNGIEALYGNFHCTQLDDDTALVTDVALFHDFKAKNGDKWATTTVMAAQITG
ncbi:MAG: exo-alpha-sialidase [Victivallales bacterium]|nr:exo-alpha-sialidase [Victivallales bacterium]